MKILFLARDLPYPANNGYRKRNFYLLKALHDRGAEVSLIAREYKGMHSQDLEALGVYCKNIQLVDKKENRFRTGVNLIKSLFSSKAFSSMRRFSKEIREKIAEEIKKNSIDMVICDCVYQSLNIPLGLGVKTVLYEHNIESLIIKRYFKREENILKKIFAYIEYKKIKRYEKQIWKRFDSCIACSDKDKQYIENFVDKNKVAYINNGVNSDYFKKDSYLIDEKTLVYTGQIGWFPNEDAVLYFAKEILPLVKEQVPDVKFLIVGANPSSKVRKLADNPNIKITGFVEDIREYIAKAAVFVVPIRIGSGTRLKILEALSMQKAVISTSIGAEGLSLENGKNILIKDTPAEFAKGVIELLADKDLRNRLEENGRKLIEDLYDWKVVFRGLYEILGISRNKNIPDREVSIQKVQQCR